MASAVLVVTAGLVVGIAQPAAQAGGAPPRIRIDPGSGPPGTEVVATVTRAGACRDPYIPAVWLDDPALSRVEALAPPPVSGVDTLSARRTLGVPIGPGAVPIPTSGWQAFVVAACFVGDHAVFACVPFRLMPEGTAPGPSRVGTTSTELPFPVGLHRLTEFRSCQSPLLYVVSPQVEALREALYASVTNALAHLFGHAIANLPTTTTTRPRAPVTKTTAPPATEPTTTTTCPNNKYPC